MPLLHRQRSTPERRRKHRSKGETVRRGKRCARRTVRTFELSYITHKEKKQCFNICIICLTKQRSDSIKSINYFQTNYFYNFKIWASPENHLNPFRKKWTDYFYYKKRKAHGQRQTVTRSPGHLLDNSNTFNSPCKNLGVSKHGNSL